VYHGGVTIARRIASRGRLVTDASESKMRRENLASGLDADICMHGRIA
jgi:hypothetical protein